MIEWATRGLCLNARRRSENVQSFGICQVDMYATHTFCMKVRIEKSKDIVTTRKGGNNTQEIRVDGKMLFGLNMNDIVNIF